MDAMLEVAYFYVDNPEQHVWQLELFDMDYPQTAYYVTIESDTGTVLNTESFSGGHG